MPASVHPAEQYTRRRPRGRIVVITRFQIQPVKGANRMTARDVALIIPITDERRRLLENQVSFTDTVRNRTTAMLSVAAIVAGLFGSKLGAGSHPRPVLVFIAVALALFAITSVLAIKMMMLRDLHVGVDTSALVTRLEADTPSSPYGMTFTLAKRYQEEYDFNAGVVKRLDTQYKWLCLLVGAQVIAWSIAAWI